jgi:hypothetical protein
MPLIDNIYETLVDSPNSIFHHMYPAEALVGYQMLDIPAVTQGNYSQGYDEGGGGRQPDCIILCDDPNGGCTNVCNWNFDYIYSGALNSCKPGTQAEVYFPHLGSIKEYFLDGIQQVLRPLGFGTGALPVATEENDVAQPRPANVDATCAWDGFGCHYFTCQCVGVPGDPDQYGWDAVNSVCHGIWQLPQNTGPGTFYCPGVGEPPTASPTPSPAPGATPGPSPAPGFDQCTGIGCGTDKAPICESGRCNPYEIRPRKDYCTQCGGHYPDCNWPFSADECTELCHKEVYTKNNEGGYGSCHYENAAVCRRNDGQGGCAGVCNWLCCS